MSRSSRPVNASGNQQILTIDWKLLWRRLRLRGSQLFTSARHRAANTEYIPPVWVSKMRLTWFRIGLIGITIFVFTQKQIDFTFSVGANGIALAKNATSPIQGNAIPTAAREDHTATLSMIPAATASTVAPKWNVNDYDAATVRAYINRFQRVAKTEEDKYSIPAPAKIAMAILESKAGSSEASRKDNNHFAFSIDRKYYDNAWSSWRAHSQFLQEEFPQLAHESVNYQQWIAALAETAYSRDPRYAQKLIDIIERFGLDKI